MSIHLTDDGTLDTVLRCDECGEEFRFNWDGCEPNEDRITQMMEGTATYSRALAEEYDANKQYQAWVEDCIAEIKEEHECHAEDGEPQDGDITTEDERTFYQDGKAVLRAVDGPDGEYWEAYYNLPASGSRPFWRPLGRFASCEQAVSAYMVATSFWPNVWSISDHGNAHRMDLTGK